MPDAANLLNRRYLDIWTDFRPEIEAGGRWPLLYPDGFLVPQRLLFVGLNPSFSVKDPNLFAWRHRDPDTVRMAHVIDHEVAALGLHGGKPYPYFAPLSAMAQELGIDWCHLDLLPLRETTHGVLATWLGLQDSQSRTAVDRMRAAFVEALKQTQPKAVVVANALASSKFAEWLEVDSTGFGADGFDAVWLEGNRIPVFFSGMLSGQRALDTQSRRRLVWHVDRALAR